MVSELSVKKKMHLFKIISWDKEKGKISTVFPFYIAFLLGRVYNVAILKKEDIAMSRKILSILFAVLMMCFIAACGSSDDALFTMYSTDAIGATEHTVVGGDIEPTGTYNVVCTKGHGCLNIGDDDLFVFAADEYVGEEYSGLTFVESMELELNANEVLMARAYNSSEFKLEFYLVG